MKDVGKCAFSTHVPIPGLWTPNAVAGDELFGSTLWHMIVGTLAICNK